MSKMILKTPSEFSFDLNLGFLKRSPRELLHYTGEDYVIKLIKATEKMLVKIRNTNKNLAVEFLNGEPSAKGKAYVRHYITEWFDLKTDLTPFYAMAEKDSLLKNLIEKYHGYRIIGQPDLFESIIWAVIGQQINLQFAYTLKQRFVEQFGERLHFQGQSYFLFPEAKLAASLTDEALLPLQFSRQKSKYTVLIAEAFASGALSKDKLQGLPLAEAKETLMKIKGIGNWTANYALMKTFRYPDAFPLEDAGVHNAIKNLRKMDRKPTLDEVRRIFKKYRGWEAYATLYLWKSLS